MGGAGETVVHLLSGPYVTVGEARIDPPEGTCALVVLLALRPDVERRRAGEQIWPNCQGSRASGNLRTALWRLNRAVPGLVESSRRLLRLAAGVSVDLRELTARATALGEALPPGRNELLAVPGLVRAAAELLPGWEDEHVLLERAWLRQHVLHAAERATRRLLDAGQPAEAAEIASCLVRHEPLRESSQRLLIEALVTEGNLAEARRALGEHRRVLAVELGIDVDPSIEALVGAPRRTSLN